MSSFLSDLRQAMRTFGRSPGFAAVAVLTLALGIGATASIYTLLDRIVLNPLPYPESDRLVRLMSPVPGMEAGAEWQLSSAGYVFFEREARAIEELGAYQRGGATVTTPEGPQRVSAARASAGLLRMLGARAAHGRLFQEPDDTPESARVAVLSHAFWKQQFGADPTVIGRAIQVDDEPVEVIGVLAPGVRLPDEKGAPDMMPRDLWLPYRLNTSGPFYNSHVVRTVARLAPGHTLESAQAELDRLTARLPEAFPQVYSQGFMDRYGFGTRAYPLKEYVVGGVARSLWILLAAVGLVLLIACANAANLFLARIEGRRRELSIRAAIGATRAALVRHLLAESLVIALAGGVAALLLGLWGIEWLVSLAPASVPRLTELGVGRGTVAFTLALSLSVAVLLALVPAVGLRGETGAAALSEGGRGSTVGRERQRVRSTLVVTQVALALVLIVGAGLLLESFRRLRAVDPGVRADGVLTMQLHLPFARYPGDAEAWAFYREALERVAALPGVTAAGIASDLPFSGGYGCTVQGFEDARVYERVSAREGTTCAGQVPTGPGYFEAMGIPVLRGRGFTHADSDQPARGAVVVSRAFAERFWPGEDPIGKGVAPNGQNDAYYHVVGVVGDVYASSVDEEPAVAIYYPMQRIPETGTWWRGGMNLVVRTGISDPTRIFPAVRAAVAGIDASVPVAQAETLRSTVDRSMSRLTFTMSLLLIAAMVALALAAIGLYGVIAYLVTRRTSELGVRIALGARPLQVAWGVVSGSMRLVAIGLLAGTVAALAFSRVLQGLLFGVEPTHPAAYVVSATVLGAVGLLASWLPARRAARVDPMVAMRSE